MHLLGLHLDHPGHHGLRNPVGQGGRAESSLARSVSLGDLHGFHRRREMRPENIRFQILYGLHCRCFSEPAIARAVSIRRPVGYIE